MAFNSTIGGVSANSLVSVNDAQDIIDATPNATAWGEDTDLQEVWLAQATAMLNVLAYQGSKVSNTQACCFPRSWVVDPDFANVQPRYPGPMGLSSDIWPGYLSTTEIPRRMKRGCVMLALEIARAGTSDVWGVDKTTNVQTKTVGELSTTWFDPAQRKNGLRLFPSVWREIAPLTMAALPSEVSRA